MTAELPQQDFYRGFLLNPRQFAWDFYLPLEIIK